MKTLSEYISESLVINEMADERKRFKDAILRNINEIIKNIIYIYYIGKYKSDWTEMYNSINHWKGELYAAAEVPTKQTSGNDKYQFRLKAINQALKEQKFSNDLNDDKIEKVRKDIFKDPKHRIKIPDDIWPEVIDFVKSEITTICDLIANMGTTKLKEHIYNLNFN